MNENNVHDNNIIMIVSTVMVTPMYQYVKEHLPLRLNFISSHVVGQFSENETNEVKFREIP